MMESLNAQLRAVKQKFPDQSKRIEELFETDEDFRTLCLDYLLCVQYLQKFEKDYNEKQSVIDEYKSTRMDLESELHDSIFNAGKPK